MAIDDFTRARDRFLRLEQDPPPMQELIRTTLRDLHAVTTFSWVAFMTVDPQTLLPTGGLVEGFSPDACAPFWDHELLSPGFNKFNDLARRQDTVSTLVDATDGELHRAPIYNEMYRDLGAADELRVAFNVGSTCWAVAVLLRSESDGPFPLDEVDHVRALGPFIARAVKASACTVAPDGHDPTAMLVLDAANDLVSATTGSETLLADLETTGADDPGVPSVVRAAANAARAAGATAHMTSRAQAGSGRWIRVTAMPMDGDGVGIVLEPARASDLTPILLEGYGLTRREVEIVMLVARGLSTREIAGELFLSAHTVRDHLKAIFVKAEVNSRGELVANLFSEHLLEGFHTAVHAAAPGA